MQAPTRDRAETVGGAQGSLAQGPRPVAVQAAFSLLVILDLAVRYATGEVGSAVWPGATVTAALLLVALAVALSRTRLSPVVIAVVPLLDIGLVGLARLPDGGAGVGVLVIVPAFWLGRILGRLGALLTLVVGLALITVPGLLMLPDGGAATSRSIVLAVAGALAAWVVAVTTEQAQRQQQRAGSHSRRLSEALGLIDHQERVNQAILDTVDVGLVLLDENGVYQSFNRRHEDFMKLAFPDGHAGHAGQMGLVYDEDGVTPLARHQMPSFRAARGHEFDDCRIWVGDDPLTRRALSVSARTVRDDDGELVGAALAYKDVTDFMRALRVKDEFVASVSHELRTPLTSIRGYVDLLLDRDDLPAEVAQHLAVVARNADRLGRLVADLLHSAQMDNGLLHVLRARGDLAAVVREALAAATPAASAVGVSLDSDLPEQLPTTMDRDRMRQVVDNLLSNAIKYTPRGGTVRVGLALDGDRVELRVEDSGIGIDAPDRDRLFTRFFRTREAEERSIQGVGLGLSITKSIIESHGGRIEVESELGRGSTFRVRLPVDEDEPADRHEVV
ncbi:MAG TPA: ATP-binding protein [Nocardioides sp.]|nr:ATP-binding protein [Nocardioides sp.]